MKLLKPLIFTAGIALSVFSVQAQVYRCAEKSGKTTYSDLPCPANQPGELLERQRSQDEIAGERDQAAQANQRKYQDRAAEREAQAFQDRQRSTTAVSTQGRAQAAAADTPACRAAQKELDFVSSIRTLSLDERRIRTNAAIVQVNASCGTTTPLMQEPPKVIAAPVSPITRCDAGFCYDETGAIYKKSGPDTIVGPTGRSCNRSGGTWICQ
ncbi:DUF4124 domain-containing protein [Xanthomonas sontii]|uniref:DUF4124 domain-containing protein n=1 Tax=Xanthomonas TaxID=338 RepID=UPI0011E4579B|nr:MULTISPECIES: DUF4124 domain-containing protein [Xanthomonas]KAB7773694.1 hypothetical protein CEK69_03005 [Xanthomonas sp. LMG 12462]MDQ7758988.1 DUF4124 domain-containing protein [Xanthomonas sontii]TYD33896.1 hypothetical protein CEK63_13215 [Xanthomonas sontii]UZK07829.1 DUF4124 domain-containing protein [Xanthomonas sontii]